MKEQLRIGLPGGAQLKVSQFGSQDAGQSYDDYLDNVAKIVDGTTAADQEKFLLEEKQKDTETVQDYFIRFDPAWEVLTQIVRRDQHRDTTETEMIHKFIQGCCVEEREYLNKAVKKEKIKEKHQLTKYIGDKVDVFDSFKKKRTDTASQMITVDNMRDIISRELSKQSTQLFNIHKEEFQKEKEELQKQKEDFNKKHEDILNHIAQGSNSKFEKKEEVKSSPGYEQRNHFVHEDRRSSHNQSDRHSRDRYRTPSPNRYGDRSTSPGYSGYRGRSPYNNQQSSSSSSSSSRDSYRRNDHRSTSPGYDRNRGYSPNRRDYYNNSSPYKGRDNRGFSPNRSFSPNRGFSPNRSFSPNRGYNSDRERSPRSRSPSPDILGCYLCGSQHRAIECTAISEWLRETFLYNLMRRREQKGDRVSPTEENELRKNYNIPKDKCAQNPARQHQNSKLPGTGPYCKYCNNRSHPTLFCDLHCDLCLTPHAKHGWRACPKPEHKNTILDRDHKLQEHLKIIHNRWRGVDPPRL